MAAGQLTPGQITHQPRLRLGGVPVFTYHGLLHSEEIEVPSRERKYWIPGARFREQLNQIRGSGYQVRLLGELWNATDTPQALGPSAVLTFDDGLASDYEIACPLLLEAGMRATFFVNTATVGERGFLNWGQIVEMQRGGMSFQSHSHNHVYLTWLPIGQLERQLRESKRMLQDRLGQSVEFLAAPYGDLNGRVLEVARRVGYRAMCNSRSWPTRPGERTANRVVVYRHTTPREFHQLLTGSPVCYAARAARETLKSFAQRLLLRFWPSPPPGMHFTPVGER